MLNGLIATVSDGSPLTALWRLLVTNIITLPGVDPDDTFGEVPPDNVLKGALNENLREVVVIGTDSNGEPFLAISGGMVRALHLMEKVKFNYYSGVYTD